MMTKFFAALVCIGLLVSCAQPIKKADKDTIKKGNQSTTFSSDTAKLSRLINIDVYKPTRVIFKYTFIDNSGGGERLSVPGPSDNYLQALLYFDPATFRALKAKYFNVDYSSPGFDRQDFDFEWLDADTRKQLLQSDTAYHGHPDYFLGLGVKGKLWLLDNKVLLVRSA